MSQIIGEELNSELIELFNENELTAVVATVSDDGYPNTAPMALFYAPDNKRLRMSIGTMHESYENIKQNEKIMVNVMEGGDYAFSIKGRGKIIKEKSDYNDAMSVVEISIEQIKKDNSPVAKITQGIKLEPRNEKSVDFLEKLSDELEKC